MRVVYDLPAEARSIGFVLEKARSELGFGRCSVFSSPILAAEPIFEVQGEAMGAGTSKSDPAAKLGAGKMEHPPNPSPERPSDRDLELRSGMGDPLNLHPIYVHLHHPLGHATSTLGRLLSNLA